MNSHKTSTLALGLSCAVLLGCVPLTVQQIPEIDGVLTRRGAPVADVMVTYRRPDATFDSARTDTAGRFHFDGTRDRRWVPILVPVHCLEEWVLGAAAGDTARAVVGWTIGRCWVPDRIIAECDLESSAEFCGMRYPRRGGPGIEEVPFAKLAEERRLAGFGPGVTLTGHYTWDPEAGVFAPCADDRELRVAGRDDTIDYLVRVYRAQNPEPREPVFVRIVGAIGPAPEDGVAARYDGSVRLDRVDAARRSRPDDCVPPAE